MGREWGAWAAGTLNLRSPRGFPSGYGADATEPRSLYDSNGDQAGSEA
jgi:hypothetical protein